MDLASMRARREVEHIQNPREGLVFCGAWVQNGFHEVRGLGTVFFFFLEGSGRSGHWLLRPP